MANPNSMLTAIRMRLARLIDPEPDPGEAWCINCSLLPNHGVALIPVDGIEKHVASHTDGEFLQIWGQWPPREKSG